MPIAMSMNTQTPTRRAALQELEEPRHIWIEHPDGSIARGLITALSSDAAVVQLAAGATLAVGNDVAVRIAVPRSGKTLAGTARVTAVRPVGDAQQCELRWTHSGPDRDRLTG